MLIQLDIASSNAFAIFIGHFRHLLSCLAHEIVVDEPLAHKLFRQLLLRFAGFEAFGVAIGIEIARAVGGVNLVDENHLAVAFAEFIFCVNQNQALAGSNLGATSKQSASVALHGFVVFLADDALSNDFFLRDVLVVTGISLGGWSDDWFREFLVFAHTLGQLHAAQFAAAGCVFAPSAAGEIAADNHFNAETFAFKPHSHHRVGCSQLPVRHDVGSGIEKFSSNLIQHLTFAGNALWQNHVECRNAVGCHHHHKVVVDVVYIAHFAMIYALLTLKLEICVS